MHTVLTKESASKGIARGEVFRVEKAGSSVDNRQVREEEKSSETQRLLAAIKQVALELGREARENDIFAAHYEILEDPVLQETALDKITGENKTAEQAVAETETGLCRLFSKIDDEYLKERVSDIRDVCTRIYNSLQGVSANPFSGIDRDVIVVADDLAPSDTLQMDFSRVRGFITREGGSTSHVCIIARAKGIPAMVGLGDAFPAFHPGDFIILDGQDNQIIINPDKETIAVFDEKAEALRQERKERETATFTESQTLDGYTIDLGANAGSPEDVQQAMDYGAWGIGLFRSEFLFLQSRTFPDEQTQFHTYKNAAESCGNKSLTIRTLDIGGDKSLPYFPMEKEENPFLGWRAIRISLDRRDLFRTQLRALLRASAYGNVKIMFPMIVSLEEYRSATELLENCKNELRAEGVAFNENIPTGVMIETPAAVMLAEDLAAEADFFSIGTNDLTQYLLAADRLNSRVGHLNSPFHPAVLRSIRQVVEAAQKQGKAVGLCGEMAAIPHAAKLLVGLGLDSLSVAPVLLPELRQRISSFRYDQAVELASAVCKQTSLAAVHRLLGIE